MLASITPLGERGRRQRWGLTVTAFLLAATAAGSGFGAALGAAGRLVLGAVSTDARIAAVAAAAAVAVLVELWAPRVPGPRRQVDRRWLDEFRGWVYGAGFGAQLGVGVATVVTSAATYVALLAAVLSCSPEGGALVLGLYGAARGIQPLATARVSTPARLHELHRRLTAGSSLVRAGSLAGSVAVLIGSLAGWLA